MNIIFCNIGWLKYYQGENHEDEYQKPFNGGNYNYKYFGNEGNNFLEVQDETGSSYCYGFVYRSGRANRDGVIRLLMEKHFLGSDVYGYVENCLVIWTANPDDSKHKEKCDFEGKGNIIVGWYKYAKGYTIPQINPNNDQEYYFISNHNNCILVPEMSRSHVCKMNFHSNVRYFKENEVDFDEEAKSCLDYIHNYEADLGFQKPLKKISKLKRYPRINMKL